MNYSTKLLTFIAFGVALAVLSATATPLEPRTPIVDPIQKFPKFVLRGLGDAKNGANFPRGDPDGSKRLARAKEMQKKWFADHPGQGKVKRAPSAFNLASVDGKSFITAIRDQGRCGSCVAFSTIATLESSVKFRTASPSATLSMLPDLSEHFLYYCQGRRQCNTGWWMDTGAITAANGGAVPETCLPYRTEPKYAKCYKTTCNTVKANINKQGTIVAVALNDLNAIKEHISTYGPISTGFNVYSDFPVRRMHRKPELELTAFYHHHKGLPRLPGLAIRLRVCVPRNQNPQARRRPRRRMFRI
jgi:hypothetical protein